MRLFDSAHRYTLFFFSLGIFSILLMIPSVSFAASAVSGAGKKTAPKNPKTNKQKDDITGWFLISNLAGSFNNPGARLIGRGGYQWRIFASDRRAFSNNFVRLNLIAQATPANVGIGPNISIQPASFVRFGANYSFRMYFPAFTVGTVFKDLNALKSRFHGTKDWSDGEARMNLQNKQVNKMNKGRIGLSAHLLRLHFLFQIKAFGFVAQFLGVMQFWFANYKDVDNSSLFFEAGNDLVIQKQDQVFSSLSLFGYEWRNLRFVLVNTYQLALQSGEENLGLGPAVQWSIAPKLGALKKPFLLFVVRWWLRHRFRTGAMPNFAVIFQADIDI